MYHADLLGGVAAKLAGVRFISWGVFQSNISPNVNKKTTLLVVRLCGMISGLLPTRILSCSNYAINTHATVGYCQNKFFVIPIGFELSKFRPDRLLRLSVREELGLSDDVPVVGLIGRFDPQKNHLGFIRACKLIHDCRPDVHFVLVGKNVDSRNASLRNEITKFGLSNVMHLLGERQDMPSVMNALDILASSSSGEGFPTVLGEAMATGIPCVATNVGDSKYILGDVGVVVEFWDMEGLANSILKILALSDLELNKLGENSRARIQNNFSIEHVVAMYEDYYISLVSKLHTER